MKSTREKTQRKYFKGGTMPDGLKLYPLTVGKRELFAEWVADEIFSEDDLGRVAIFVYAHPLGELEQIDPQELAETAQEFLRVQTSEDVDRAQEYIKADFEAIAASVVEPIESGKQEAGEEQKRRPSPASIRAVSA